MARTTNKLTDTECKATKKPGLLSDGGGLYLNVKVSGAKSWTFIWRKGGKRNEMGLGAYPAVKLAAARKMAGEFREAIADGRNPITERQKEAEPTFAECADKFLASMKSSWRNEKHKYQWEQTLGDAYCHAIRSKKVSEIETHDILKVLAPIWTEKHETASRLRGRIERVLDFARVKGWRTGENPALWRGHLRGVLPTIKKRDRVTHLSAMPYSDVPGFMQNLRKREALTARALEFQILTAARPGEVRGAKWREIDLDNTLWIVPKERMKTKQEHRVPLTEPALAILKALHEARTGDLVFPGYKKDRPLSDVAFANLLDRMGVGQYVPHGFRSAFRDWCGDCTSFPREIAEAALAHQIGNEVERSYRRSDALEKRRKLMQAWADFLAADSTKTVVNLSARLRKAVGT